MALSKTLFIILIGLLTSTITLAESVADKTNWYTQRQNLDALAKQQGTAYNYPPKRKQSVQTAVQSEYEAPQSIQPKSNDNLYVGLLGGALSYPFQNSMPKFSGAAGVAVGVPVGLDFWIESGFLYSFQDADTLQSATLRDEDVDHFGVSAALKSFFGYSNHWIMPSAGLLLAYSYRRFNGDERTSTAIDGGISAGFEVAMNQSVNVGLEGRYMRNFSYDTERVVSATRASQLSANQQATQDLESLDYWVFLLNAKMKF